jgi:tRNA(fMet)-specific endonuclease VapC
MPGGLVGKDRATAVGADRQIAGSVRVTLLYMLDTDTVSYALRGQGRVAERILGRLPSELCISAITEAELRFGADRRKSKKLHQLIDAFIEPISVVALNQSCAVSFGKVGSKPFAKGKPIGQYDTLIAAHAVSLDVTLVTNSGAHFGHVDGLKAENWLD